MSASRLNKWFVCCLMFIGQCWLPHCCNVLTPQTSHLLRPSAMGCSPYGLFRRTAHTQAVVMAAPKPLKRKPGKTGRSGFHHLIIPALPFQPAPRAGADFIGGVAVLSLWVFMLYVTRLLLAT